MVQFNAVEARVLGSLIEKEITTPEYYPLSLNALVNACNQKSSRDPVMELQERDVRSALSSLEEMGLVRVLADGRVSKFEHRVRDGLSHGTEAALRRDEVALLCLLLLRGAQTAAELRARAERLYAFEDAAAVQTTLERLASREEPLTATLPRQPGAREVRWKQRLTGDDDVVSASPAQGNEAARAEAEPSLATRVASLEARVQELEERLQRLEG